VIRHVYGRLGHSHRQRTVSPTLGRYRPMSGIVGMRYLLQDIRTG